MICFILYLQSLWFIKTCYLFLVELTGLVNSDQTLLLLIGLLMLLTFILGSLTVMLTLLFISTYVLHMSAAWRLAFLKKKFWLCWSFCFHEHYLLLREILPFIAQLFSILMLIEYLLWLYQMKCFKEMFSQSAAIGILIFLGGFSLRLMYILFFYLHSLCLLTVMSLLMGAPTQQNLEVQS